MLIVKQKVSIVRIFFRMVIEMQIYQRFKEVRKSLKMTQTEFGNQLGKGLRAIQHYEAGERSIDNSIILLLKEKFNVNTDWLINGVGSMFLKSSSRYDFLLKMLDDFSDEELAEIIKTTQAMVDKKIIK